MTGGGPGTVRAAGLSDSAERPAEQVGRSRVSAVLIVVAVLLAVGVLVVVGFGGTTRTPTTQERVRHIATQLHCPVCADLSAADSPAPLARQMRRKIADELAAGVPEDKILQNFVDAYGPSVLMSPPEAGWGRVIRLLPFVVMVLAAVAGGLLLRRALLQSRAAPGPAEAVEDLAAEEPGAELVAPDAVGASQVNAHLRTAEDQSAEPRTRPPKARWYRLGVAIVATGALAAIVSVSLVKATHERAPSVTASGSPADAPAGGAMSGGTATTAGEPSAAALAAVEKATAQVKDNPKDVSAHLELARAYARANQAHLATVEFLAVIRLDPGNPEANTALALAAFLAGSAEQAEKLASKALETRPRYPEALYVRGLVRAMGLQDRAGAREDLKAYLKAAPFGAHRTNVETLLAVVDGDSK